MRIEQTLRSLENVLPSREPATRDRSDPFAFSWRGFGSPTGSFFLFAAAADRGFLAGERYQLR